MAAQAHFGLAKLAENRGDFDTAGKEFLAAKNASPSNYPILGAADQGINEIATLRQKVNFATTAPATQPASAPAATHPATVPAEKLPTTGAAATAPATERAK